MNFNSSAEASGGTYSLVSTVPATTGAAVAPATGVLTWTSSLADSGVTRFFFVSITKDGLTAVARWKVSLTADADADGMTDQWESDRGLDPLTADATLDPDGDGMTNLMEFALDTNPQSATPAGRIQLTVENGYATLTIDRNPAASGLIFTPERSTDLATWQSGSSYFTTVENTPARLKVRLNDTVTSLKTAILRLKVIKQ